MADGYRMTLDASEWDRVFAALDGPVKESLSRRMLVEGGVFMRDQAKLKAQMADNKEGVERRGLLAHAIYLAYDTDASSQTFFRYTISWNAKIAPHGHLIEFGHWMTHKVYKAANGQWYTRKDQPLASPKWVGARSFLRPTYDSYGRVAIKLMIERGRSEFPKLLQEHVKQ